MEDIMGGTGETSADALDQQLESAHTPLKDLAKNKRVDKPTPGGSHAGSASAPELDRNPSAKAAARPGVGNSNNNGQKDVLGAVPQGKGYDQNTPESEVEGRRRGTTTRTHLLWREDRSPFDPVAAKVAAEDLDPMKIYEVETRIKEENGGGLAFASIARPFRPDSVAGSDRSFSSSSANNNASPFNGREAAREGVNATGGVGSKQMGAASAFELKESKEQLEEKLQGHVWSSRDVEAADSARLERVAETPLKRGAASSPHSAKPPFRLAGLGGAILTHLYKYEGRPKKNMKGFPLGARSGLVDVDGVDPLGPKHEAMMEDWEKDRITEDEERVLGPVEGAELTSSQRANQQQWKEKLKMMPPPLGWQDAESLYCSGAGITKGVGGTSRRGYHTSARQSKGFFSLFSSNKSRKEAEPVIDSSSSKQVKPEPLDEEAEPYSRSWNNAPSAHGYDSASTSFLGAKEEPSRSKPYRKYIGLVDDDSSPSPNDSRRRSMGLVDNESPSSKASGAGAAIFTQGSHPSSPSAHKRDAESAFEESSDVPFGVSMDAFDSRTADMKDRNGFGDDIDVEGGYEAGAWDPAGGKQSTASTPLQGLEDEGESDEWVEAWNTSQSHNASGDGLQDDGQHERLENAYLNAKGWGNGGHRKQQPYHHEQYDLHEESKVSLPILSLPSLLSFPPCCLPIISTPPARPSVGSRISSF
jgi:hypothetical protein